MRTATLSLTAAALIASAMIGYYAIPSALAAFHAERQKYLAPTCSDNATEAVLWTVDVDGESAP